MMKTSRSLFLLIAVLCISFAVHMVGSAAEPEKKSPEQLMRLGEGYELGLNGKKIDMVAACTYYQQAVELKYPQAMVKLGLAYLTGRGVPANAPEAVKLLQAVAEQNNPEGQYYFAWILENGIAGSPDKEKAKVYYEKATKQDFGMAKVALQQLVPLATVTTNKVVMEQPIAKNITIGGILELTGEKQAVAQSVKNGIDLYLEQIQQHVRVKDVDYHIEFVVKDNKNNPQETEIAMQQLKNEGVVAVLGPLVSSNAAIATRIADEQNVPLITPTAAHRKVIADEQTSVTREYAFQTSLLDDDQGKVMADFAVTVLKKNKVLIVPDNSSSFSQAAGKSFEQQLKAKSNNIIPVFSKYDPDKHEDSLRKILEVMKDNNPEVVFIPGYMPEIGKIVEGIRKLDAKIPIIGTSTWYDDQFFQLAKTNGWQELYFYMQFFVDENKAEVKDFMNKYHAKYNKNADQWAVLGYDATKVLVNALQNVPQGIITPLSIHQSLLQTKKLPLLSGELTIHPTTHQAQKSYFVVQLHEGVVSWKGMYPYPEN